jgi:peroxiredoxin
MKSLLPLFFALMLCGGLSAQTVTRTTYAVDENSIVKDSTGRQITKIEFYEAVMSGNYNFKPVKDKNGKTIEFTLVHTDKENNNTHLNIVSNTANAPTTTLTVGQVAPQMTGTDLSDSVLYDLSYYKGRKVVVLNFWFTRCKPCIDEIEDLNRIKERYKDRADIVFIAPTFDYPEVVDSFLTTHPFKYAILPEAYDAIRSYKAMAFPLNVIIDVDGKIAYVSAGGLPGIEYLMDKKIKDLLGITKDDNLGAH